MQKNLLFRGRNGGMPFSLLQLLLLFWVAIGSAQNVPVHGTVTDAQGVLPGVTVQIKNKSVGTFTDGLGRFTIDVLPEDVLVISSIGYSTVEVLVGLETNLNITLKTDATALNEVLVNAGYYKVKDKERTGNIAKITAAAIENQPVTNVLASMQGRMAGVNITQTTGVPGGGFEIQIRGINSLQRTGNDPLYLIDGVPYSSAIIGSGQNSGVLPGQPSPLNSINPDQIESIEVLKDADATAIYGSRGANGVVLITTKKGSAGKTQWDVNLANAFGTVTRFVDLLSTADYIAMREEAFANDGVTTFPATAYDVNGTWDRNRYTHWQKELLGGTSQITQLSTGVSGGSALTQYRASGSFTKQTTVFPGDFDYKKASFNLSSNHTSENRRFIANFSSSYTYQNNMQPRIDFTRTALLLAPNAPALYQEDGTLNWENSTWNNPLANLEGKYEAKTDDWFLNAVLSYQLLPHVVLKSNLGYTTTTHSELSAAPSTQYDPAFGVGAEYSSLKLGNSNRKSWIVEPQVGYQNQWGKLRTDALIGGTFQSQSSKMRDDIGQKFSSNSLIYNLASASVKNIVLDTEEEYRYAAFFGRVNFNWDDKYILNLTGRRDGSSRFGPGKQFGTFGAVGAAWLFSNEALFSNSSVLSFGKIRGSYGITGSDQIGNYQFLDTYGSTGSNYNGVVGLQPTRLFNPLFGWETNHKLEGAVELGFLKDRIYLTAAYYKNRSSNQLAGMPLPGTTGFGSLQYNLDATVENTGLELSLRTVNISTKNFKWTSDLNITFAKNKLVSFPDLESSTFANTYKVGEPLNIRKVYHFTGVDPTTGLYTFEDFDGDGAITSKGDREMTKDLNPSYFGGFLNSLSYKNFQLDFLFQFVKQENYNVTALLTPPGFSSQQSTAALDRWQNSGDISSHQLYTTGLNGAAVAASNRFKESDAAITDASFVRLKNISLSYRLPSGWIKNLNCRLYAEAQNLLTWTKYKGADPEFKYIGFLPPLRVFNVGLQITL